MTVDLVRQILLGALASSETRRRHRFCLVCYLNLGALKAPSDYLLHMSSARPAAELLNDGPRGGDPHPLCIVLASDSGHCFDGAAPWPWLAPPRRWPPLSRPLTLP